ncbi:MAG: hypothetical protein ACREP7_06030, partial [Lysobacter sp.]
DPVRFAIPAVYMELVEEFDGERSTEEAIDAFIERKPGLFQKDWLRRLVDQSLIPKGILVNEHQDPSRAGVSTQSKRAFLYIKLPIIKPGVVDPIAKRLSFMYRREAMILGLLAFIASHVYVYAVLLREQHVNFNQLDAGSILLLMLFSTVGTLCHEFGHASAAAHYGCRRMTIGWGLYLIYTVLWTNVSEAWKLPRRQRAIVDIGGVYFESIFLLAMLGLYLYTGNIIFLFAFIFTDLSIANTFNPFLRMDGYWLMSDLFGIVNLRKQQIVWLQSITYRLFGGGTPPVQSNLSPRAKWVLGIYTVLGSIFLVYILTVIFRFVVLNVLGAYPTLLAEFWQNLQGGMTFLQFLNGFLEIFWRTLMLFGASVTLWSLARGGINLAGKLRVVRATAQQGSA